MNQGEPGENSARRFRTTHWSVVRAAGATDSPRAAEALAALCESYWYPLYAYVRRSGYSADQSLDLTQEFFARVLEKHYLRQADAERGRFRSFLLAAMKHFLATERDRESALKRGGGRPALPLEIETAEGRYQRDLPDYETPDRVFERRWALATLDRALVALGDEYRASGRAALFDRLKELLTEGTSDEPYARIAETFHMSEGAVKVAAHRLRRRFGDLLRAEIAHTVSSVEEIDDEMRYLFKVVGA